MLWTQLFVQVLLGVLGLSLIRSLVRRFFPKIRETHLDVVLLLVLVVSGFVYVIDDRMKESILDGLRKTIREAETKTKTLETKSTELQKRTNDLLQQLDTTVNRTATIEVSVSEAQKRLQGTTENLSKAEKQIQNLKELLGKSEAEVRSLKGKIAPRSVSADAKQKMIAALGHLKDEQIDISCLMGDADGCNYARQFRDIFAAAGWKVNGLNHVMYSQPLIGMEIQFGGDQPSMKTNYVANLLTSLGLYSDNVLYRVKDMPPGKLRIFVGSKP